MNWNIIKALRQRKRNRRIENGLCPYCEAEFISIHIFDGEGWRPTLACPILHFAIKHSFVYSEDDVVISFQILDLGGASMPIPEEYVKYGSTPDHTEAL
jgi:hypothetical protein